MKLPAQRKILREDLKDAPDWVGGIIDPVNGFMESTYQALNRNITLQDNVASFVKEFPYKTPSAYPAGVSPVRFQSTLKTKAIGVVLLQVVEKNSYIPAPGPVYIPWVEDAGNIEIHTITGLEPSKSYIVRVVVF